MFFISVSHFSSERKAIANHLPSTRKLLETTPRGLKGTRLSNLPQLTPSLPSALGGLKNTIIQRPITCVKVKIKQRDINTVLLPPRHLPDPT